MTAATDSILETMDQIKTVLDADATVASNFATIGRIISPRLIPPLLQTEIPAICQAPVNSPETWQTTHKREQNHIIEVYVVNQHMVERQDIRESIAKVKMVTDVLRGNTLTSNYLSKPLAIVGIDYDTLAYGDENRSFLFVATITIDCRRLFIGT